MKTTQINGGIAETGKTLVLTLGANTRNEPIMSKGVLVLHKDNICFNEGSGAIIGCEFIGSEYVIDNEANRKTFKALIKGKSLKEANDIIKNHKF